VKTSRTPPIANNPSAAYDGPPDYRVIGRHAVFPQTSHDEIERINFLAQMNRHLAARVVPGVKVAYEQRVAPAFESSTPAACAAPPGSRWPRRCTPTPRPTTA
jgi:hypothetical protein